MHNLKFKPGAVEGETGSLGEPPGSTHNDVNKVCVVFMARENIKKQKAWV